ncbi:MAG: family 2 glycosyl transferase [Elainellaceae cyanobacterium]
MVWQLRVRYANGTEQVLRSYTNRETALLNVDALYSQGYPLHIAYIVRGVETDAATV